jgi:hypothetical protein
MRATRHLLVLAAALALAPAATGSITVATNASRPALRVDAQGNAEVSWSAGGRRQLLLVPAAGRVRPGVRLSSPDVAKRANAAIPFSRVVVSGRDGWTFALQSWQVVPGGPVELRYSRWRGAATVATLAAKKTSTGVLLTGKLTLNGRPVPTTSRTPEGKVLRQYAYLDVASGGSWKRLGGVAVRADGTFRRYAPQGTRFRVVAPGPNVGRTYAPDASATASVG